jgi:hypothetical protein
MGDMSKGRPDPNATIELSRDALDQVELIDNELLGQPAPAAARQRPGHATPPPLPPPGVGATAAPQARRGAGRNTAAAVLLFAFVAAAIAAGLIVGSRMRGDASPKAASSAAPGPSGSTLVLPTVEIRKP